MSRSDKDATAMDSADTNHTTLLLHRRDDIAYYNLPRCLLIIEIIVMSQRLVCGTV